MTKEAREIAAAFKEGRALRKHRTRTDGLNVFLHNNCIAWRDEHGAVQLCLCGWPTVATRGRRV